MTKRLLTVWLLALILTGCDWFGETLPYEETGLPLLEVQTRGGKGIREITAWKKAEITLSEDGRNLYGPADVKVKGRGHSSWSFPKKPFNIQFDTPTSLFGMPAAPRWCVLANWRDATLMRNAVSLEIARQTDLPWVPEGVFLDVVMDGSWQGNFYLTEKVDPERLGVYPGGFLVCFDSYYDEPYRFKTARKGLPVNIVLSEGLALDDAVFGEIRDSIDAVENALYRGEGDWADLLDMDSFIDWFIVHELTTNDEPSDPHSVYMYRLPGGKIIAGPVWDFDYHTFRDVTGLVNDKGVWFDALLKDERFRSGLIDRWKALRPAFEAVIPPFIDRTRDQIAVSAEANREMWPIYRRTNGDETLSFEEATARLRQHYLSRITALDQAFDSL